MRKPAVAGLLAVAFIGAPAPSTAEPTNSPAIAAKTCSSGKHAVVPGGAHKCLRAGQFCVRTRSYQRVYHAKGFNCKTNRRLERY